MFCRESNADGSVLFAVDDEVDRAGHGVAGGPAEHGDDLLAQLPRRARGIAIEELLEVGFLHPRDDGVEVLAFGAAYEGVGGNGHGGYPVRRIRGRSS
ncbi:MAG: hypothetical protein HC888_08950 [Candidatus Competibacteraceae bacterium]|nr:hypothetical protein [Candidatus Competibacteraceae bacterium]